MRKHLIPLCAILLLTSTASADSVDIGNDDIPSSMINLKLHRALHASMKIRYDAALDQISFLREARSVFDLGLAGQQAILPRIAAAIAEGNTICPEEFANEISPLLFGELCGSLDPIDPTALQQRYIVIRESHLRPKKRFMAMLRQARLDMARLKQHHASLEQEYAAKIAAYEKQHQQPSN